jgi:hypothetical protein
MARRENGDDTSCGWIDAPAGDGWDADGNEDIYNEQEAVGGLIGPDGLPITRSSLASTSKLEGTSFSPLNPDVSLPAQQKVDKPQCLLFPTMAADVRTKSAFNVYWGQLEKPWFVIDVKNDSMGDIMELKETQSYFGGLCASMRVGVAGAGSSFLVNNTQLKANTRGLAFRTGKDNSKVRNAVAAWGSTVAGVDTGDGWVQVGDWFLPMVVEGCQVLTMIPAAIGNTRGMDILRGDGTVFATFAAAGGGMFSVTRNGSTVFNITINTGSQLLEARMANQKMVGAVAKDQVRLASGEMMLELCVEPNMDPVLMLVVVVAALRQLPPHGE